MTRLALLGALLVAAATLAIALVAGSSDAATAPDSGRLVLGRVLFLTPGVIGLVGAWRREPAVLGAAGMLCLLQSAFAFSGVSVLYLPAALAFVLAAAHVDAVPARLVRWSPLGLLGAVVVGVVVTALVLRITGILGVLAVVAAGGIAGLVARAPSSRVPLSAAGPLLGVAVVGLVLGGWLAASASTQEVCWVQRRGPTGTVREVLPAGAPAPTTFDAEVLGGGCESGVPTREGAILAIGLAGLAVMAAAAAPTGGWRRSRSAPAS